MVFFNGARGPLQLHKSSSVTIACLILSSCIFATTTGYDSALINGINIMPSYTETLQLTTATKSLNSASTFLGWAIVSTFMGPVVDRVGRRTGVLISVFLKLIGVALMSSAQEVVMFIIGRIMLGAGAGTSSIASSTWLAETLPKRHRAAGLSFVYTVYYVGALIAAGVTYRTADISGSWSWRIPCLLQAIFSILCLLILFFVPESPRWLAHRGRVHDALISIASTHSDSDITHLDTVAQHRGIIDMIEWERLNGKKMGYLEIFKTPSSRRRLMLVVSVAVLAMSSGNNLVTYYLGDMLNKAGITDSMTQLKVNIILTAWCLIVACLGTWLVDRSGRKIMCLISVAGMTVFIFLLGACTKLYGSGGNTSGVYGTVATIFLFQASYAIGITPLTILYPPEILNFSIRSNGMAAWTFAVTCGGLFSVFVWPFALEALGWQTYMINGAWNVVQFLFVAVFWIETRGLSLEEIDSKFDRLDSGGLVTTGIEAAEFEADLKDETGIGEMEKSKVVQACAAA
ncbi:general substrate transporter [Aspergillus karnatakaensis]|uniref:general substrate transporter n=1 Tax=Aspergillus karnatakaensis TaxID=1810916 RepID=UPI003CCCFD13